MNLEANPEKTDAAAETIRALEDQQPAMLSRNPPKRQTMANLTLGTPERQMFKKR
jgi:hypothetical protein